MKVAIFTETYFPFISGVVTPIKTLKESLEHAGHEVLIVTTSPKAVCHYVKDGVLYCPAIPLKRIYGYGLSNPVNIQRLRIIQDFDPDIIHIWARKKASPCWWRFLPRISAGTTLTSCSS